MKARNWKPLAKAFRYLKLIHELQKLVLRPSWRWDSARALRRESESFLRRETACALRLGTVRALSRETARTNECDRFPD